MKEEIKLQEIIVQGLNEKKGKDIVVLDLDGIPESVTRAFVICTGSSTTQVSALADSVVEEVRKKIGEKPWHIEGKTNSQWILIDYVSVVVHVFLNEYREFYGIEELWNDAVKIDVSKDLA